MHNRNFYRLILGQKSKYAEQCFEENFIGADCGILEDLSSQLPDNWRQFNKNMIPVYQDLHPEKTKVAAGLACGMLHTVCKGMKVGDIVLCPDGQGSYHVGEVSSDYLYEPGSVLPHRRNVNWHANVINRDTMSEGLKISAGSSNSTISLEKHSEELERLLSDQKVALQSSDETIEDPSVFALEKHLEEFLIANWNSCELSQNYDLFEEDGDIIGQQYQTDTGFIDILAVSKDRKVVLVIELKKGRASDAVVGQIQRYMGYIRDEVAEENQSVRGCIIALEDDLRIKRALRINPSIDFYRYEVSFRLQKL